MLALSGDMSSVASLAAAEDVLRNMQKLATKESAWATAALADAATPACMFDPIAAYLLGMSFQSDAAKEGIAWARGGGVGDLPDSSSRLGAEKLGQSLAELDAVNCP
jgi:hypothetical protein